MSLRDPRFYDTKTGKAVSFIVITSFIIGIGREVVMYLISLF